MILKSKGPQPGQDTPFWLGRAVFLNEVLPCCRRPSGRWESGNRGFRFPLFHGPQFFRLPRFGLRYSHTAGSVGMWESRDVCEIPKGRWKEWKTWFWFSAFPRHRHFHRSPPHQPNRGGTGDSILQRRNRAAFAVAIFFALSVSLTAAANLSSWAKLTFGLMHFAASGSDFSFSYGVA